MESGGVGRSFGKYRVLREIGRGGMGVVYLAEDTMLGRNVALKVLHRALTSREQFEQRFWQEARTLARLAHPNIVQIHALDRIDDDLIIVMPYIEGGSLADALESGRLRRNELLGHMRGILDALASCHACGVIHRDVKPSNILLETGVRPLLTDFGLAKLLAEHYSASTQSTVSTGFFLGTPRYAPPESWDGLEPTPAWDVYSVGTVMYEALAARTPYDAESPFSLIKQMIERPVPPLIQLAQDISPELSSAVDAMLAREPAARPQNATEALSLLSETPEFESLDAGTPSPIVRVTPPKTWLPWGKRREWRAFGQRAALGALLLLVAAGVYRLAGFYGDSGGHVVEAPGLTPAADILDTNAPYLTFDMVDVLSQKSWPGHWLMVAGDQAGEWAAMATSDTRLMFLHAAKREGNMVAFTGSWAEYTDQSARLFRNGTLSGTGQWRGSQNMLMVSLEFRSAPDGYRWRHPYVLELAGRPATPNEVVHALEENGYIVRLIDQELLPRNLTWARDLENTLLAPTASRADVLFVTSSDGAIRIGGGLDDAAWVSRRSSQGDVVGELGGRPEGLNGRLVLRYDKTGLYLGFHVAQPMKRPRIVVAVQTQNAIPIDHSPRWFVQLDNSVVSSSKHTRGNRTITWRCAWTVESVQQEDVVEAEVFIPFENLDMAQAPAPGERWRMNCSLSDGAAEDAASTVYWGYEKVNEVEHGAILVFGSRTVSP